MGSRCSLDPFSSTNHDSHVLVTEKHCRYKTEIKMHVLWNKTRSQEQGSTEGRTQLRSQRYCLIRLYLQSYLYQLSKQYINSKGNNKKCSFLKWPKCLVSLFTITFPGTVMTMARLAAASNQILISSTLFLHIHRALIWCYYSSNTRKEFTMNALSSFSSSSSH